MKRKLLLSAGLVLALMTASFSQKNFQTGTNVLNLGVGLAGIKWQGISYNAVYEYGITDDIGIGAHLGYSGYSKSGYKYTAFLFGGRASYHFKTSSKADPYAGAELGFASISHTGSNESVSYKTYPKVGVGIYGGVRYYLNSNTGIYAELRLSVFSVVNAGVCFKL
jgi:hypothetical protein